MATETNAAEGVQLESRLMQLGAAVVVTGRMGQATRYWATAPGVHEPCAGQPYQDTTPEPGTRVCNRDTAGAQSAAETLDDTLAGLGAPSPAASGGDPLADATGVLPFVVAANASGPLGAGVPGERLDARDGYWNGYSVVRVPAAGDPTGVIVEQRPIFDWIMLRASAHVLRPGQKLDLRAAGREPVGYGARATTRFDDLTGPAVTHRFDLVEADPERPWQPKVEPNNGNPHGYVPVDPSVASVDRQTGRVTTGRTNHPRILAVALLSVGGKSATWPLVFEPKRSFVAQPPKTIIAPSVPPIRVLGLSAASLQAPPTTPPPATPPPIGQMLSFPAMPGMPTLPGANLPPATPPVPPAPPAPPGGGPGPPPLNLSIDISGISLPPTPGVSAQPTPPVNPAPPGGARKEARQKQAATAKSEESGAPEAGKSDARDNGGDAAGGPFTPGASAMTRIDRTKAEPSMTALRRDQASAWATGLQWGGGISLMALALALGWTTVRPTRRPLAAPVRLGRRP
jgi:hypothetical protein